MPDNSTDVQRPADTHNDLDDVMSLLLGNPGQAVFSAALTAALDDAGVFLKAQLPGATGLAGEELHALLLAGDFVAPITHPIFGCSWLKIEVANWVADRE